MPTYETVVVVNSKLSDEEIAAFLEKTKELINKGGGAILSEDRWGRRKLAYPIRHVREGYYLYFKFTSEGSLISRMHKQFRLQETILRVLTVVAEVVKPKKEKKPKKPKVAAATTKVKV